MNERGIAMGLSILGGLIFIFIVPKLLSGFLGMTAVDGAEGAGYGAGKIFMHLTILAIGGLSFWKASQYWKRVRAKEEAEAEEWNDEGDSEEQYDSEDQSLKR